MKFEQLLEQLEKELFQEDRVEGKEYTQLKKGSKKPAQSGDELGDIILELQEHDAGHITKLAKQLNSLKKQRDSIDLETNKLKDTFEGIDTSYFSSEDLIYSRIIKTARTTMKFAKIIDQLESKYESVELKDVKVAFDKIAKLISEQMPDLSAQLKSIKDETIKVKTIAAKPGSRRIPTVTVEEGIKELAKDALDKIKGIGRALLDKIKGWVTGFDKKNKEIEEAMAAIKSMKIGKKVKRAV